MTSSSSLGSTQVTLQFDLNRNIDAAARDVEAAINAARTYLPANLPGNPTYRKWNPADAPIMIIGLTSDVYSRADMYDSASTIIQQKLSQIQGVGQVNVGGGALPSVRVEVNPTQLNSYGLTLSNVQSILSIQNSDFARGQISNGLTTADIITNGQMSHAAEYAPLIIGYKNGAAVRLSDVAQVIDSTSNVRNAGYLNGKQSIVLIIFRQPGANIIQTVDRIYSQLALHQGIDSARHGHDCGDGSHHHHPRVRSRCRAFAHPLCHPRRPRRFLIPAKSSEPRLFPALPCRCRSSAPSP